MEFNIFTFINWVTVSCFLVKTQTDGDIWTNTQGI